MVMSHLLDNIRVSSPCPASWASMSGTEQVRFCSECRQRVYDLSQMSRVEAEAVVGKPGRVCVRFFRRADGKIMTRDCPVGLRRVRQRVAIMASLFLGLTLSLVGGMAWASLVGPRRSVSWVRNLEPFQTILRWIEPEPEVVMGKMCAPPPPAAP